MRTAAAAAGSVVALAAAVWTALLAAIATALLRAPDPNPRLDGDPCCPHPDTWLDVVLGAAAFAALAALTLGLLALTWTLASIAATGSPPAFVRRR